MDGHILLGTVTALTIFVLAGATFVSRLMGRPNLGYWFGLPLLLSAVPLVDLFVEGLRDRRPALYILQISLMLTWLAVEFWVDY